MMNVHLTGSDSYGVVGQITVSRVRIYHTPVENHARLFTLGLNPISVIVCNSMWGALLPSGWKGAGGMAQVSWETEKWERCRELGLTLQRARADTVAHYLLEEKTEMESRKEFLICVYCHLYCPQFVLFFKKTKWRSALSNWYEPNSHLFSWYVPKIWWLEFYLMLLFTVNVFVFFLFLYHCIYLSLNVNTELCKFS